MSLLEPEEQQKKKGWTFAVKMLVLSAVALMLSIGLCAIQPPILMTEGTPPDQPVTEAGIVMLLVCAVAFFVSILAALMNW